MKFKEIYRINESLYANANKLFRMLSRTLGDEDLSKYIAKDKNAPDELILIRTSILEKITEVELKKICGASGFYYSIHYGKSGKPLPFDPIYVTPKTQREPLHIGRQEYYHASPCKTLDITGIRLRSRKVDNEFDIYYDRIYLLPCALIKDTDELIIMVADEHNLDPKDIALYKVILPDNYEVYQDPTKRNAVYITNFLPAKYITKVK